MSRLRRLAIVLVAIGLVTSAVYATGAFSSLGTSRDANVNVAGDKAGYLGLQPGENGEYTTYQNGKLQLQLNGALGGEDAPSGGGVNREAETTIDSVFTITNQGAQSVGVWLEDTDDHIDFERASGGSLEGNGNAVALAPGDTVHVGLTIDTTDTDADQLDTQLIINADSDVEGVSDGTEANTGGPGDHAPPPEEETENADGDGEQTGTDGEQTDGNADEEATVTIEGITLRESDANAFVDGMIYGDRGMSDGDDPQDSASSPFYALGQLAIGFVPGLGDVADIRDAHQQVKNEKLGEAAISSLAAIPIIGSYFDGAKATNFAKTWIKRFPSKGDDIASLLAKHVAPHMPEKLTVELIDIFTDGKASKLKDNGKSVDDIIERAKNGKLDENPNKDKKIVTDGGSNIKKQQINDINNNLGNQVKKPIKSSDVVDEDITDSNGNKLVLLNTDKFKNSQKHLKKGPGYRHIISKHVDSNNPNFKNAPVAPGTVSGGTKFPNKMNEDDVIDSIKITAENGNIPDPKNDPAKIVYSGSELRKYGIKEMRVIRDPNSGMIITAYPTKL